MKITNKEDFAVIANRPELKDYLENKAKKCQKNTTLIILNQSAVL